MGASALTLGLRAWTGAQMSTLTDGRAMSALIEWADPCCDPGPCDGRSECADPCWDGPDPEPWTEWRSEWAEPGWAAVPMMVATESASILGCPSGRRVRVLVLVLAVDTLRRMRMALRVSGCVTAAHRLDAEVEASASLESDSMAARLRGSTRESETVFHILPRERERAHVAGGGGALAGAPPANASSSAAGRAWRADWASLAAATCCRRTDCGHFENMRCVKSPASLRSGGPAAAGTRTHAVETWHHRPTCWSAVRRTCVDVGREDACRRGVERKERPCLNGLGVAS
jgi:hypothetical protein